MGISWTFLMVAAAAIVCFLWCLCGVTRVFLRWALTLEGADGGRCCWES